MEKPRYTTTIILLVYHGLLLLGLSTMLIDGWGRLAFLTYGVGMPAGALIIWRCAGRRWRALTPGFSRSQVNPMMRAVLLSWIIPTSIFGMMMALGWAKDITSHVTAGKLLLAVIVPQFVVATIEELAFRGVTQTLLVARFGTSRGLIITALLFGLFHLPNALYQGIPAVLLPVTIGTLSLLGWVLGKIFQQTQQRLIWPIVIHWAWNVACFTVEDLLSYYYTGPKGLTGSAHWFPESGLLGTAGVLLLGLLFMLVAPSGTGKASPGT